METVESLLTDVDVETTIKLMVDQVKLDREGEEAKQDDQLNCEGYQSGTIQGEVASGTGILSGEVITYFLNYHLPINLCN